MKKYLIILLFFCSFNFDKCYAQETKKQNTFLSAISDKDTFDISKPINKELTDYFAKPADLSLQLSHVSRSFWNCGKEIAKKNYWYQAKNHSLFYRYLDCDKDKSPVIVVNTNNPKVLGKDDVLIEVHSTVSEPVFSKNNFIDQKITDIIRRFGNTYIRKNGYLIYYDYTDKILILYAPKDKVISYKFVRLNKAIKKFADLDKEIFKM